MLFFCSALPLGGRASSEGGPWVCRDVTAGPTPSFCFAARLGCGGSKGEGVGTGGVRSEAAARGAELSSPQPHCVGRRERCVEGMSAFSEAALEKKLSELSNSQQSVQTLSLWLIHHRKHSRPIVTVWERELRKAKPNRKLTFLYLANDVIQNSKRKGPEFTKDFCTSCSGGF